MTFKEKFKNEVHQKIKAHTGLYKSNLTKEICKLTDEFAIAFHNWMRKNDTPENIEKFFHYTDEDMLNAFKEETGWI